MYYNYLASKTSFVIPVLLCRVTDFILTLVVEYTLKDQITFSLITFALLYCCIPKRLMILSHIVTSN